MAWITMNFRSNSLRMAVECEVLVPQPGYKSLTQDRDYKVIFLLHGANNDRTEWLLKSQIYDLVKEEPIIVCMPSAKNSCYINTKNGYHYMDYICKELPEILRTHFHVSPDPKDWMIAGESMGGYGALVCGLNYPEVFRHIGAFSPAVDITAAVTHVPTIRFEELFGDDWEAVRQSNLHVPKVAKDLVRDSRPRIFLCCGEQDFFYEMNQAFYMEFQNEYDMVATFGQGKHDFLYWNERLKELIPWFKEGGNR